MNSDSKNDKPVVAILMSVRDEEDYIDLNIQYHLDLGFDYIFITNHCSQDKTNEILKSYSNEPRVIVIEEKNQEFDHSRIIQNLYNYANSNYKVDWFIFLDADEFLALKGQSLHGFVGSLENNNIPYITIGWVNALFDSTLSNYTCTAMHPLDTMKYYMPWPERPWQEFGHFRKAMVKNHKSFEVVVGGHYVKTQNNPPFFAQYDKNPFIVPKQEARILHFEFRNTAEKLYKKWERLALFENDSTSDKDSPWLERIHTIRKYVSEFGGDTEQIKNRWFTKHRTFWGNSVSKDRIVYDPTLLRWHSKYFKKNLENGKIKSVCLARSGNLGDVVMTEPVAKFLSKYVDKIYLATRVQGAKQIFTTYDDVYEYEQINSENIDCDAVVKLTYELSDNSKTYIQGYLESVGFYDIALNNIPTLNNKWNKIIDHKYILIAPHTSSWEEEKRNWGYDKFIKLSKLLERKYNIKCVVLENKYSFSDMMSLISHSEFVVGNDSGPAVVALSFNKKTFTIFGGTHPKYLPSTTNLIAIYDETKHALCNHNTRQEEIDCCEEFCLKKVTVETVFDKITKHI